MVFGLKPMEKLVTLKKNLSAMGKLVTSKKNLSARQNQGQTYGETSYFKEEPKY